MSEEEIIKRLTEIVNSCKNSKECQKYEFCSDCYIEIEDIRAIERYFRTL